MTELRLVGAAAPGTSRSRLRYYADVLARAQEDIETAWTQLPPQMKESIRPGVLEAKQRLQACIEQALVVGYRLGLVDFYEQAP